MGVRSLKGMFATSLAVGALFALSAPSSAGVAATMIAIPNPGFVGSSIAVSNTANSASTCEEYEGASSAVHLTITAPNSTVVHDVQVVPDQATGNWSSSFVPAMVGTYMAQADCFLPGMDGDAYAPLRSGPFSYQDLPIVVQQQASTTSSSTSTTRPSTTSSSTSSTRASAAAAAVAVPRFTG